MKALRERGKMIFVLTNNSTDSVETVYRRLKQFHIGVAKSEVLTSALLTAEYLLERRGRVSYFLVGEDGLDSEMKKCGHRRTLGERADVVVVGLDRKLTYEKLDHAARLVRNGASLVATHSSRLYMYRTGPAIATGPLVKALEYASGRRALVIGKPSPLMFRIALERVGCSEEEAVMVGDQVDTDILGARRAGIDSLLVTTGIDSDHKGTGALGSIPNVDELVRLL